MLYTEEISWMSKSGYSDIELLEYIDKHCDEIECELSGEVYKEPKKRDHNFSMDCNVVKTIDYERSTLVCTKCGLCEYYPVYVASYNHMMQPLRRKCKEIECELNGEVHKEPKKRDHNFCMDCNMVKTIDYERSTLVCTKCGLCEYYPVYVASYNHMMQPLRRKCIYKRSDNFKVILNQFFYREKKLVPDDIMETIRGEIHDGTNILYPYEIPLTIPILECIN